MPKKTPTTSDIARKLGARGGKARAKKYNAETLSKWGKLGGRPRKEPVDAKPN